MIQELKDDKDNDCCLNYLRHFSNPNHYFMFMNVELIWSMYWVGVERILYGVTVHKLKEP